MPTSLLFPQLLSRTNHRRTAGFSLIELLVVVLIIGVLIGVGLPAFLKQRHAAQDRAAQADLTSAGKQAKAFYLKNGDSFDGLEDHRPADWVSHRGEPVAVKQLHTHVVCLTTTSGSGTEWALRIVSAPVDGYDYVGEELGRADELEECGVGEDTSEAGEIILTAAVYDPNTGNLELEWEDDPEADSYEVCVEGSGCVTVPGTSWSGYTGGRGVTVRSIRNGNGGPGTSYHPGGSGSGHTPPPPVGSGGEFTVEQVGNIVRLTFVDTGTGADSYEIRRCVTAGCTDGAAIATIPSDGPREYTYDDNVTALIENGVEVARYQVVAFKGVYGTASNWAEVHLVPQAPEGTWSTITAGGYRTCGITTTGAAYCWGENRFGQLGTGDTDDANAPQSVQGGLTFASITAGLFHTCGLTPAGKAYCWGFGGAGQLGTGDTDDANAPQSVQGGLTFASITAGNFHTCGLTPAGKAYCWGYNEYGQLGTGDTGDANAPQSVQGGLTFASITAGQDHTCGLTPAGKAYCWGRNTSGQLGTGDTDDANAPQPVYGNHIFETITSGGDHTCGTTTDVAYCWGYNEYGQLGTGDTDDANAPQSVQGGLTFASITADLFHTCGLTPAGKAYCWGLNDEGQLGTGDTDDANAPQSVQGGLTFASITAGNFHTCGTTTAGKAYCWGHNWNGQLGTGNTSNANTPQAVDGEGVE